MNGFTEVADDVTYVGCHKIFSKIHKTFQILVRPDASEASLLSSVQQILLKSGGAVTKHVPISDINKLDDFSSNASNAVEQSRMQQRTKSEVPRSPYLEVINNATLSPAAPWVSWQVIRVYLGVNMDLQRCVVLSVEPSAAAAGVNLISSKVGKDVGVLQRSTTPGVFHGIGVNTYSHMVQRSASADKTAFITVSRKAFLDYCESLACELNTAMREESLTIDYLTSVPASMTGPMQGLHQHLHQHPGHGLGLGGYGAGANGRALDSLVDLAYIRDLQCATAQLMTLRLHEQAKKLDFRTKIIEQKCARLMTLLKPSFVRAKLELPVPPMSRSLLQYELVLERSAIGDSCSVDVWKLVLLRARRRCREVLQRRGQVAVSGSGNSGSGIGAGDSGSNSNNNSVYDLSVPDTRTETQIVLDCILEQFVTWAQDEYKQRLFRKISSVKDRLETIHHFRIRLLLSLNESFAENSTTSTSASGFSWLIDANPEATYQRSVRDKFPSLSLTSPVLFESQATTVSGKMGILYLTLEYALFHSYEGFAEDGLPGTPAEIVAMPLCSVVLLELIDHDSTLVRFTYASDTANTAVGDCCESPGLPLPPPSAQQPNTIRLVDATHSTDMTLAVTGFAADHARRVAELLDLLIKTKLYRMWGPHAAPFTESSTTYGSIDTISECADIMDLLTLSSSGDNELRYIRDLQSATIQLMADQLDHRTKFIMQKCARLMTLLKPSFARANVTLPTLPATTSETAIEQSCGVDVWKLVLLRARRRCREVLQRRGQVAFSGSSAGAGAGAGAGRASSEKVESFGAHALDIYTETQSVLDSIFGRFTSWAQEEYKTRLFSKITDTKERLEVIHHFRVQLVLSLHKHLASIDTNDSLDGYSVHDRQHHSMPLSKAVLLETQAILLTSHSTSYGDTSARNERSGVMFVTLGYLLFHSPEGLLSLPEESVLVPFDSVVLLEVVDAEGSIVTISYTITSASSESSDIFKSVRGPAARQPNTIRLVDASHTTDVTLTVTGLTEDYVRRVADLLDLIIKDKLWTQTSSTTAKSTTCSAYRTMSDLEDIRELLTLPTSDVIGGNNSAVSLNVISTVDDASASVSSANVTHTFELGTSIVPTPAVPVTRTEDDDATSALSVEDSSKGFPSAAPSDDRTVSSFGDSESDIAASNESETGCIVS